MDTDLQPLADEIKYLRKEIAELKKQLKDKDAQLGNLILINMQLLNITRK